MAIRITRRDLIWSYAGYTINLVNGIILLPLLLKFLSQKELGLWYAFLSLGGLVNLLDFGFSPTIMRNVSYSFGGAKTLIKEGVVDLGQGDSPNASLLYQVIHVSRRIYLFIALAALLTLATLGTYYVHSISMDVYGNKHLIAWFIYCVGIVLNLYYSYWNPVLRGIGGIMEAQKATIASRLLQILVSLIGLLYSGGLIALSLAYLFSSFALRYISRSLFIQKTNKYGLFVSVGERNKEKSKEIFLTIWHNAWRLGLVLVGAYLITQANTLICSYYLGLEVTAKYGLTLQIFGIIGGFASILASSYLPVLNDAVLRHDGKRTIKIISVATVVLWLAFISGSAVLIFFGEDLVQIASQVHSILPTFMLIVMAIYLLLEANHSIFATYIASENRIPFVLPSLLSGFGIVASSMILVGSWQIGLWGLLLSQLVIQLLYNNWKWPLVVMKKYSLTPASMIKSSVETLKTMTLD